MKTILQVEDDPNDVFFMQHAMKKVGVANPIQVTSDGQEAIDYLKGAGKFADRGKFPLPCLVLLDLKLPYVMGLDVLKWIRQQPGAALPVIILTASSEDADIATAYRLGANGFLTKPSEASKLEDMVKAIKDFWLTHNTLPQESLSEPSMERVVVSLVHSSRSVSPRILGRPVNGTRREEWPHNAQTNI
jgi:two-component system response regulator